MTPQELEFAEKRMHQKWYDLVMAEQGGTALPVLEHMYNSYILAVEVYNRCSEEYQREHQAQTPSCPPAQQPVSTPAMPSVPATASTAAGARAAKTATTATATTTNAPAMPAAPRASRRKKKAS